MHAFHCSCMGYIYMYEFDDGMRYIGQTKTSVEKRHKEHMRYDYQYVDRKLKKHKYKLVVLCELPDDLLNE